MGFGFLCEVVLIYIKKGRNEDLVHLMSPFKILNPRNPHGVSFIKAVFYCIGTKM